MTGRRPERALPGTFRDLIVRGVPDLEDTWGRDYDREVWLALNRTAASAVQAGYDFARWTYELEQSDSRLGAQARRSGNRKERSHSSYYKLLGRVWDQAEEFVAANPLPTHERITEDIAAARAVAEHPDSDLTPSERAVLGVVCDLAQGCTPTRPHPTTRPAVPYPTVMDRTSLTLGAVRHAIRGLIRKGHLTRDRPGNQGKHLAALYSIHPRSTTHMSGVQDYVSLDAQDYVSLDGSRPAPQPTPPENTPPPSRPAENTDARQAAAS